MEESLNEEDDVLNMLLAAISFKREYGCLTLKGKKLFPFMGYTKVTIILPQFRPTI